MKICFHKWYTKQFEGKITYSSIFKSLNGKEESILIKIKFCAKCKKRKAWVLHLDGSKEKINPDFIC